MSFSPATPAAADPTAAELWLCGPLRFPHGFSRRALPLAPPLPSGQPGGYAGMNFDPRGEGPARPARVRETALAALGFDAAQVCALDQVHGDAVLQARPGVQRGDALVTAEPGLLLSVMTADCYPILLEDAAAGVLGAAHAGWRGTVTRIAEKTVERMVALGADPGRIRAAVGPGICAARYPVGGEVARAFREAGLGAHLSGERLDLAGANVQVLREAGLSPERIWCSGRCSTEDDFYSYRRDGGVTGRMWAVIGRLR